MLAWSSSESLPPGSDPRTDDIATFMHAGIMFWPIGTTDRRGKEFSLFSKPGAFFWRTQLCDVLSAQASLVSKQICHNDQSLAVRPKYRHHPRPSGILPPTGVCDSETGVMPAIGNPAFRVSGDFRNPRCPKKLGLLEFTFAAFIYQRVDAIKIEAMKRADAIKKLRTFAGALKDRGAMSPLYLFGSTARRQASRNSDLDLFLDDDPRSKFNAFDLVAAKRLPGRLGVEVDLTTRNGLHPLIRKKIESRGQAGVLMTTRTPLLRIQDMLESIQGIRRRSRESPSEIISVRGVSAVERGIEVISEAREVKLPTRRFAGKTLPASAISCGTTISGSIARLSERR